MKKKMLFLFAVVFCFGAISCGDKDDEKDSKDVVTPVNDDEDEYSPDKDFAILVIGSWKCERSAGQYEDYQTITLAGNGKIGYEWLYYDGTDDFDIMCDGTYTVTGNMLKIVYSEVVVTDMETLKDGSFKGYTNGRSKNVTYTIVGYSSDILYLKDSDNTTLKFERYR